MVTGTKRSGYCGCTSTSSEPRTGFTFPNGRSKLSQPVVEPTPETPATEQQPPEAPAAQPETDWKAEAEKWKQYSRQNEDRAKANADAAKRLKEIEDRDLSELQKAQRDLAEVQARAEKAERAALRSQVALDKGIPADLVETLSGATLEELTSHADRLLAWRAAATPAASAPTSQPRPDASQGAQALTPEAEIDAAYAPFRARLFPSHQQ